MNPQALRDLLDRVRAQELPIDQALHALQELPFRDVGIAMVDHHRALRQGIPEVIFAEGRLRLLVT